MHRALLLGLMAATGCVVALDDHPGRACDATHPCREGRSCVDGFCASPEELDAGASVSDGGTSSADGGPP